MKKFVLIGLIFLLAVVASGCGATRYDIKPEIKSEILLAKQTKEVSLTPKYYRYTLIVPLISRGENINPDVEQTDAGKKFLNLVKEELRNKGFIVSSSARVNIEVGFAYKKGITLIHTGFIATRWKVSYKDYSLFEMVDSKNLSFWPTGEVFTEGKGKELAQSIVEKFSEEFKELGN